MDRLLTTFPNAKLLHLTRHPRSMGKSMMAFFDKPGRRISPRMARNGALRDPEDVWRQTHEMIVSITRNLPPDQYMRIKGEALLSELDVYLPQILPVAWAEI